MPSKALRGFNYAGSLITSCCAYDLGAPTVNPVNDLIFDPCHTIWGYFTAFRKLAFFFQAPSCCSAEGRSFLTNSIINKPEHIQSPIHLALRFAGRFLKRYLMNERSLLGRFRRKIWVKFPYWDRCLEKSDLYNRAASLT